MNPNSTASESQWRPLCWFANTLANNLHLIFYFFLVSLSQWLLEWHLTDIWSTALEELDLTIPMAQSDNKDPNKWREYRSKHWSGLQRATGIVGTGPCRQYNNKQASWQPDKQDTTLYNCHGNHGPVCQMLHPTHEENTVLEGRFWKRDSLLSQAHTVNRSLPYKDVQQCTRINAFLMTGTINALGEK